MRTRVTLYLPALLIALWAVPSDAAEAVKADTVVHVARVQPTHHLIEVSRFEVLYGTTASSLGFVPGGPEYQAMGPAAFDVDEQGRIIVADPVRGKVFRLDASGATVSPVGALPLPFSDLAIDRNGKIHVADLKTRSVSQIGRSGRTELQGTGHAMRFVRYGRELVIESGSMKRLVRSGALSTWTPRVEVEKCNAEAGLITVGATGKKIQVEIGGPLASIRLIGVGANGDTFLAIEQFRQRGQLAVDVRVVVIDASGRLKATLDVTDQPAVHPDRDFVLGPRGDLYRMVPGTQGVTFVRWEVRP